MNAPSSARILASIGVACLASVMFVVWVGWSVTPSVFVGLAFGAGFFAVAAIAGADPRPSDAAWRAVLEAEPIDSPVDPKQEKTGHGPGT